MRGFLLDTNIPSEMTRPYPQLSVTRWLDNADDDQLYFSVISLGEILKGITAKRLLLASNLGLSPLSNHYAGHILSGFVDWP
jgi:predicted nucleic acid-binding protein